MVFPSVTARRKKTSFKKMLFIKLLHRDQAKHILSIILAKKEKVIFLFSSLLDLFIINLLLQSLFTLLYLWLTESLNYKNDLTSFKY